jgi:hypothetical protein
VNKNVSADDEKRARIQILFVYSLFLSVIDIYICIYSVFSYIIRLKEKKKKKKKNTSCYFGMQQMVQYRIIKVRGLNKANKYGWYSTI